MTAHQWKHEGVTSPEARQEIKQYIDNWIRNNPLVALNQMYAYYSD